MMWQLPLRFCGIIFPALLCFIVLKQGEVSCDGMKNNNKSYLQHEVDSNKQYLQHEMDSNKPHLQYSVDNNKPHLQHEVNIYDEKADVTKKGSTNTTDNILRLHDTVLYSKTEKNALGNTIKGLKVRDNIPGRPPTRTQKTPVSHLQQINSTESRTSEDRYSLTSGKESHENSESEDTITMNYFTEYQGNFSYTDPVDYFSCGKCICNSSRNGTELKTYANCRHLKIMTLTNVTLPPDMVYLDLSYNKIVINTFTSFSKYDSLSELHIAHNQLKEIKGVTDGPPFYLNLLDLQFNYITKIEDGAFSYMPYIETLLLQYNNVTKITNNTFLGLSKLKILDVSHNYLTVIDYTAFDHCPGLDTLQLHHNIKLSYKPNVLSKRLFQPLKNLTYLGIHCLGKHEVTYPSAALSELSNLRTLLIDGVYNAEFGKEMISLKYLNTIYIGHTYNCYITNLTSTFFENVPYAQDITIGYCEFKDISPEVFHPIKSLIGIRFFKIRSEFDFVFSHLPSSRHSELKYLTVSYIDHDINSLCRCLTGSHAEKIKYMKHIDVINLDANQISCIDRQFVLGLPQSLRVLTLRKNLLTQAGSILYSLRGLSLPNLQEVLEDEQNRDSQKSPDTDDSLEENLNYQISRYRRTMCDSAKGQSTSSIGVDEKCRSHEELSDRLTYKTLRLQQYSAVQSFRYGRLFLSGDFNNNSVRILNISSAYNGGLRDKSLSPWTEVVDISNTSCDTLSDNFFHPGNRLVELHMRNNFFGYALSKDIEGVKLSNLHNLQYIDMSTNMIQDLPFMVFKGLKNVKIINLSSNNIRSLHVRMSHMTSLMFLDLNNNNINSISKDTRDDLDMIALSHKVSIDLTSNPLPCTCDSLDLLIWLATTKVTVLKKDFLQCQDMQPFGDLHERVLTQQRMCVSNSLIIVLATSSVVVVVIIAVAALMFRNRWRLYYIRNIVLTKYYGFQPRGTECQNYKFDAYLLYVDEDREFVLRECLEELEKKRGHKLCVEDRDFIYGTIISCNITSAIQNSRVTIPVISPEFWEGEWSEYGVEMAVMESNYMKRSVLHLLIYKPVNVDNMSRDLIKVHKENNFNEYPPPDCSEDVKAAFWDTLSRTIGHSCRADCEHPQQGPG